MNPEYKKKYKILINGETISSYKVHEHLLENLGNYIGIPMEFIINTTMKDKCISDTVYLNKKQFIEL